MPSRTPKQKTPKKQEIPTTYIEAVGRRKTAVARVRLFANGDGITINNKQYKDYFPEEMLWRALEAVCSLANVAGGIRVSAIVEGGGMRAQAYAVRHGLARAFVKHNEELRKRLREHNLLTRDPRMKERRKFGLKKARRAPQWSKR